MRLINAEDVKKRADCYPPSVRSVVANILSHIKTVKDAVKVVRCADCEFYTEEDRWCRRLGLCGAFDRDGFCSHGERSEDE